MSYQKINIITGWVVFAFALLTYTLTVEPTASFWDAGEFISCGYKLQVPHPPGAPLYLLSSRIFSLLAGSDVTQVAFWINMQSVLSSAFCVLFLFWIITHLGRKTISKTNEKETLTDTMLIMGTGVVGALAATFSDSFWFSAVEAEVYALSVFITFFVVWAVMKWENEKSEARQERWLLLIAYMMGLSIGVHLLNLVILPAIGLVIYFKKYKEVTAKRILITLGVSAVALFIILNGVITGLPSIVEKIEIQFVNGFGLPFGSGVVFSIILFIAALIFGLYYFEKKKKQILHTILLSFTFIIIGYSSYTLVLIRSTFDPPIDENNPEDIVNYISYLKREQYGSRPLFKGPYYTAQLISHEKGSPIYKKGKEKYEIKDYKIEQKFDPQHSTFLPRMYSKNPSHVNKYRSITGLREGQKPSWSDNIYYMVKHQIGYFYFRYFMWNFMGREHDKQGASWVGVFEALNSSELPDDLKNNGAHNVFFGIPLLLGLLGMFFQYTKSKKFFFVTLTLFIVTGVALIVYLNSPPIEPRERDYIYAGSFCTFCIWIGFGVFSIYNWLSKLIKIKRIAAITSIAIGLIAPIIMLVQGWDDHDRSKRYFSVDAAKNYLASCAPNAILFTGGDNDTFPLWYAQEVEGFRTDVRILVLSYYNTDWYIHQSMRKINKSEGLPYGLSKEHYTQGGLNDYLPVRELDNLKGKAINAESFMRLVQENNVGIRVPTSISAYNSVPAKTFFLSNIDTNKIIPQINPELKNYLVDKMIFNIKGNGLEKKDLAILDIIVNNKWERPIYFNNTSLSQIKLDLKNYVVQEGITYRLLPVKKPENNFRQQFLINTDKMYDNLLNHSYWRNLNDPSIYYTQDYLGIVLNSRTVFYSLANALINEGKKEKAAEVLRYGLKVMPNESISFDISNAQQVNLLLRVGETELAKEVAEIVSQDATQWIDYFISKNINPGSNQLRNQYYILNELSRAFKTNGDQENGSKYEKLFSEYYAKSGAS